MMRNQQGGNGGIVNRMKIAGIVDGGREGMGSCFQGARSGLGLADVLSHSSNPSRVM